MALRSVHWNQTQNLIIFLLLIVDQTVSAKKNAGSSKKKDSDSGNRVTFSLNNPFFNNLSTSVKYQGNPFLNSSVSPILQLSQAGNNNGFLNSFIPRKVKNNKRGTANYSHNPFLISNVEIITKNNTTTSPNIQNHKNKEEVTIVINSTHTIDKKNSFVASSRSTSGNNRDKPTLPNTERPLNIPEKQQNLDILVSSVVEGFFTRENSRSKSDLKCEEYGKQVLKTTETISLIGTSTQVIKVVNDKCTTPDRLVTGGSVATQGEFPHMVALGKVTDGFFIYECGGTLISSSWVLTAAHCTHGPDGGPTVARVGFYNLRDNQSGSIISIGRTIRHPSYKSPAMYADIALIKLQNTVTFNDFVRPACLYQLYDKVPRKAWASGWGVTELAGEQSEKLRKAQLNIIDNIECSMKYNESISVPYGITPSMICAGDPQGGWIRDTCQGDSGGPLQVPHPKYFCLFQVIGITSFGDGCAIVDIPGVYTRVSHYLNWIEDIVWPDE